MKYCCCLLVLLARSQQVCNTADVLSSLHYQQPQKIFSFLKSKADTKTCDNESLCGSTVTMTQMTLSQKVARVMLFTLMARTRVSSR